MEKVRNVEQFGKIKRLGTNLVVNTFFRVDSSIQMGTGHLMRCLTLADALRKKESNVSFICRELPGNICDLIEKKGFKVYRLPYATVKYHSANQSSGYAQWLGVSWKEDAEQTMAVLAKEERVIDWLIIDHYALDKQWETLIRPFVGKIMVIDDLADRPHNCDLLLDQNLYEDIETRYEGLVPNHCQLLLGPRYALLRQEFIDARKNLRERDGSIKNILIFFGGVDPTNETLKALEAIQLLNRPDIAIDVVVGESNPHKDKIEDVCSAMPNAHYHCQVDSMAQLMANADLAIGGGGTTTWERCLLALPAIVLVIAENQMETTKAVAKAGAICNLGWSRLVSIEKLMAAIKKVLENKYQIREMGKKALSLMGAQNECVVFENLIK